MFLRQSTASQEILLGPFVNSDDGNTAETGLTIANTDIKVWKHGATTEASKNSGGATHISAGRYYAVLDATDTNTIGNLEVNIHVSGALPVRRAFVVLDEAVYDALLGTTAISTLDAAGVRAAVGLASANLDTQLDALPTAAENATAIAALTISEPAAEALFGTTTLVGALGVLLVPMTNKKTFNKDTGVATYRNNADNATLWTTTATDDGTTRTIGKAT